MSMELENIPVLVISSGAIYFDLDIFQTFG